MGGNHVAQPLHVVESSVPLWPVASVPTQSASVPIVGASAYKSQTNRPVTSSVATFELGRVRRSYNAETSVECSMTGCDSET